MAGDCAREPLLAACPTGARWAPTVGAPQARWTVEGSLMGCNRPTGVADATLSGAARLSARHSRHQQRTRHQCTAATAAWLAGLLLMALALGHGVAAPTSATSTASASAAAGSRAAAQPCIECSQCLTASCQRICSSSCRGGRVPAANAALVNSDQCRYMGEEAADAVAGSACRAVQV